jgi:hypothetical protein
VGTEISYDFKALSVVKTHPFRLDGLTDVQPVQACWTTQRVASLATAGGKEEKWTTSSYRR